MKKPKIINLFIDSYSELSQLSDAQAGRLIKALLVYADSGECPDFSDDTAVSVVFSMMRKQVDRDFEKYREICEKRSKAGRAGAQALRSKNDQAAANADKCRQDKDKDKDKDEDKDNDEYEDEYKEEKESHRDILSHIIPLEYISDVMEIMEYLNERTGMHYRPSSFGPARRITDRLQEGCTVEDCKRAIDCGYSRLKGTGSDGQMLPYFLFGNHFYEYVRGDIRR